MMRKGKTLFQPPSGFDPARYVLPCRFQLAVVLSPGGIAEGEQLLEGHRVVHMNGMAQLVQHHRFGKGPGQKKQFGIERYGASRGTAPPPGFLQANGSLFKTEPVLYGKLLEQRHKVASGPPVKP